MHCPSEALAEAHQADLYREARQAHDRIAAQAALQGATTVPWHAVTLRLGTTADMPALKRLATLDSTDVPAAPFLLAEVGGELRAAVSLTDRQTVADPFHPTAPLEQLLLRRAEQLLGDRSPRVRRLRESVQARRRRRRTVAEEAR